MARTPIPVVTINSRGGVIIGATSSGPAEVNGDTVNNHVIEGNDGRVILHARNSAAGTINITHQSSLPAIPGGFVFPARTIQRVGVGDVLIGPFPVSMFGPDVNIAVDSANWRLRAYKVLGARSRNAVRPLAGAAGSRMNLPITTISRAGIDITAGVAEVSGSANNQYVANDGNVILIARATSIDISYDTVAAFTMDGQAVSNYAGVVVFTNPVEFAGPYDPEIYNQPDGNVYINAGSATARLRALWLPYQD